MNPASGDASITYLTFVGEDAIIDIILSSSFLFDSSLNVKGNSRFLESSRINIIQFIFPLRIFFLFVKNLSLETSYIISIFEHQPIG